MILWWDCDVHPILFCCLRPRSQHRVNKVADVSVALDHALKGSGDNTQRRVDSLKYFSSYKGEVRRVRTTRQKWPSHLCHPNS